MATNTAPRSSTAGEPVPPSATDEAALPTLADVLDRVASHGPQIITRGDHRFVVLEAQDLRLHRNRPGLVDALLNGPRFDGVLIERDPDTGRDIEL